MSKGENLTIEQALTEINKKGIFEEINAEENTGTIYGYTVTLGYNENGKVVIIDIEKDTVAKITVKMSPEGYTNQNVELEIGVKPKEIKITNIEVPSEITKNEQGKYEVSKNGIYLIKVTLENGKTLEREIKIEQIDKLPPKEFEVEYEQNKKVITIKVQTTDREKTNENTSSGIDRYEYFVVDKKGNTTRYENAILPELANGTYQLYIVAYDKAGNSTQSTSVEIIVEEEWEYTIIEGKVILTKYIGSKKEVIVPEKYEVDGIEYEVELGDSKPTNGVFTNNTNITKVILPKDLIEIKDNMFYGCSNLIEVNVPSQVLIVGKYAFAFTGITKIELPNEVTCIDDDAFYYGKLQSINLPESLITIGKGAFSWCEKLTNIEIPDSVTEIGEDAFWCCKSLYKVALPNGLSTLNNGTFGICENLKKVWIPKSVKSIKRLAFDRTTSATIYCESIEEQSGWYTGWNNSNKVKYNITKTEYNRYL